MKDIFVRNNNYKFVEFFKSCTPCNATLSRGWLLIAGVMNTELLQRASLSAKLYHSLFIGAARKTLNTNNNSHCLKL